VDRLDGSDGLELSEASVAELIPNIVQEMVAVRFGIEELLILLLRKLEVAINFAVRKRR
jgi:hypothetical protein